MRPLARGSLALAFAGALACDAACSLLVDTSDLANGSADGGPAREAAGEVVGASDDGGTTPDGAGNDAAEGGGCGAPTGGPAMTSVGSYCIDRTEVTYLQYQQFVTAKNGSTAGQSAACAWNTSFGLKCTPLTTAADAPVTCVNWCDAYAFCAWAGKRLCGRIGGGASTIEEATNAATNQWHQACTKNGATQFPYGTTYQPGVCNDTAHDAGKPIEVASLPGCVGGYPDLFDMSGNATEWADECDGLSGQNDTCHFRGGAWDDNGDNVACFLAFGVQRDVADNTVGFRCCSQ